MKRPGRWGTRGLITGGVAAVVLTLALAAGLSLAVSAHVADQRNRIWCPVLATLTAQPPDPGATAADRRAFAELASIRAGLGC